MKENKEILHFINFNYLLTAGVLQLLQIYNQLG